MVYYYYYYITFDGRFQLMAILSHLSLLNIIYIFVLNVYRYNNGKRFCYLTTSATGTDPCNMTSLLSIAFLNELDVSLNYWQTTPQ